MTTEASAGTSIYPMVYATTILSGDVVVATFGHQSGALNVYSWGVPSTVWLDFPLSGFSGLGTGGPGGNPWIATVCSAGNWFENSYPGDIVYRNTQGSLLFGATRGTSDLQIMSGGGQVIVNNILTVKGIIQVSNESVSASGSDFNSSAKLSRQYSYITQGQGGVCLPGVDNAIYWINNHYQ